MTLLVWMMLVIGCVCVCVSFVGEKLTEGKQEESQEREDGCLSLSSPVCMHVYACCERAHLTPLVTAHVGAYYRSPEVRRRTASWGSRDAFTDGHISGAAPGGGGGVQLLNKGLTSRVHAFRKLYNTPGRIQRASSFQDLAIAYTQVSTQRVTCPGIFIMNQLVT